MVATLAEPNTVSSDDLLGQPIGEMVLRIRGTPRHGQIIRLKSKKCTVGSGAACTLRLRMPGIRDLHCLILRGATGTVVRRWSHDTLLNGAIFTDAPLRVGDRLGIGPIELEVLSDESQAPQTRKLELRRDPFPTGAPAATADTGLDTNFSVVATRGPSTAQFKSALELGRQRTRRLVDKLRDAQNRLDELQAAATQRQEAVAALAARLQKLEVAARHQTSDSNGATKLAAPISTPAFSPAEIVAPLSAPLAELTAAVNQLQAEVIEQRRLREQHDQALRAEWDNVRQTWHLLESRLESSPASIAEEPSAGELPIMAADTIDRSAFDEALQLKARELDDKAREFEDRSRSLDDLSQRLEQRAAQIEKWSAQLDEESRQVTHRQEQLSEELIRQEFDRRRFEEEMEQRKTDLEREEARLANQREELAARQKLREAAAETARPVPAAEPIVESTPVASGEQPPATRPADEDSYVPPAVADVLARLGRQVFPTPREEAADRAPVEEPVRKPDPMASLDEIDRLRLAAWKTDEPTTPSVREYEPAAEPATARYEETTREDQASEEPSTPHGDEQRPETDSVTMSPDSRTDDSPVSDASPLSNAAANDAAEASASEDDDSIESYTARLLKHVGGSTTSSSAPVKREPEPTRASLAMPVEPAREPEVAATPEAPLDPSEYIPRTQAPERSSSLSAMREVANATTRMAIENSDKRRGGDSAVWKLGLAGCGLVISIVLSMLMGFESLLSILGIGAGLVIAVVFGFLGFLAHQKNGPAPGQLAHGGRVNDESHEDEGSDVGEEAE